jgi:hypothetical protein
MFKLPLYLMCLMSLQVYSKTESNFINLDWNLEAGTRYNNNQNEKTERIQDFIRLGFTVDVDGKFELIAVASTGGQYDSVWETTKNLKDDSSVKAPQLFFRQLYLQKTTANGKIQVGALPMERNLPTKTGIDENGWGDGVRVEHNFKKGLVEVVVGSIDDYSHPDVFTRKRSLNFFEVEVTRELFENLTGEVLVQHLQGSTYLHGELIYELKNAGEKVITLMTEYFHDVDTGSGVFAASAETDLLKTLLHKYDGRLMVTVGYMFIGPDMGVYGKLSDDYFMTGGQYQLGLKGNISRDGRVSWFAKAYVGEKIRVQAGVSIKLSRRKN